MHAKAPVRARALEAQKDGEAGGEKRDKVTGEAGRCLDWPDLRDAHWGLGLPQSMQVLFLRSSRLMRSWRVRLCAAWSAIVEEAREEMSPATVRGVLARRLP